jgi:hypothetical protein
MLWVGHPWRSARRVGDVPTGRAGGWPWRSSGTPYFTFNPGDQYWAWDTTETFDYMPSQFVTFRAELTHRWASVPYFAGPGGVTPPAVTRARPAAGSTNGRPTCSRARTASCSRCSSASDALTDEE